MGRVLISGASGLIGAALASSLQKQQVEVVRLVRHKVPGQSEIAWNLTSDLAPAAVSGFDAVVHLAGESVAGRWTVSKMRAIRESRVTGTRTLAAALARTEQKPRVLICASAVGFYGDRGDEVLTEDSSNGAGFLAEVSRDWEAASQVAAQASIRTVNLRIGLVLSTQGGALAKMLPIFRLGGGGRLGSGRQWWSWIHLDDLVAAIHHAIQSATLSGPLNLVAPNPVRNSEFTEVLASVLRRPAFFPIPRFALELAFGTQAANELFLASARVTPKKLLANSYSFRFHHLQVALEGLLSARAG